MENSVLLVVDVQNGLIKNHPYNELQAITNIRRLLGVAREQGLEQSFC